MSKLRINFKDRRIASAILLMLAVIVVVNVRTFMPDLKRFLSSTGPTHEDVPIPADLNESAQHVTSRLAELDGEGGQDSRRVLSAAAGAGAVRNPFELGGVSVSTARINTPLAAKPDPEPVKEPELVCTAVMLAGDRPTALINGKARHVGDQIAGYRLARISRDGVLLVGKGGHKFLPVGAPDEGGSYHAPVRDSGPDEEQGE